MRPKYEAGKNIALKVPFHEFDKTVSFYRDILGLQTIGTTSPDQLDSITFKFGDINLWVDRVSGMSQAEVWLEIETDDVHEAAKHLKDNGIARRDEIEPLPQDFRGFWICSPSNIIHLINQR